MWMDMDPEAALVKYRIAEAYREAELRGLVRQAKPANHAWSWSRRLRSASLRNSWVWSVPVFPPILSPGTRACLPLPSATTAPVRTRSDPGAPPRTRPPAAPAARARGCPRAPPQARTAASLRPGPRADQTYRLSHRPRSGSPLQDRVLPATAR